MPEETKRSDQESRVRLGGGFWVRSEVSPSSMTPPIRPARRVTNATDNKENVLPLWAVAAHRRAKLRNSPLPSWYPRTPLRDITIIVNALEKRRRARAAAFRAAASRQRDMDLEATPESEHQGGDMENKLDSNHTSSSQLLTSGITETSGASVASFSTPSFKSPEQPDCTPGCLSGVEQSTPIMPSAKDLAAKVLPSSEYEKKLERSIDQIEKVVKKQLRKSPKRPIRKSTRVLMSMR